MRKLLAALALGLLGALALSGQAARDTPPPSPAQATATPDPAPPRAPQPLRPSAALPPLPKGPVNADPSRRLAAFTTETGVRVVDLLSGRTRRDIDVGRPLRLLAWTGRDRLVAAGQNELYEIDARAGRVTHTEIAPGDVLAVARRGNGYVTVQARGGRAEVHFGDEQIRIPGVRASADPRRMVVPGLAIDGATDTAYVVDAVHDRFAAVDLAARTVRVQSMGVARAAKGFDMAVRYAAHLGDGRLAVSGERNLPSGEIVPYGLRLIDVNALRTIMLAPRQGELAAGRTQVVAWELRGGGIAIYGRGGGLEHRLLRGEQVYRVDVIGGFAHVRAFREGGRRGRAFVVALASGKVVRGRRARASAAAAPGKPVLGVASLGGGLGRIARYDPLTLRRQARGALVHGHMWDWDRAPGGGRVALGVSGRGRIEIFDARAPVRARRIEIGVRMPVHALRWATRDRLVALAGATAYEVDVGPPELYPGLAVEGGLAYVAPAGAASIVRVDLAGGAVTSHGLRAAAAKGGPARTRALRSLGYGRLLLTGQDLAASGHERAFSSVVDTAAWTERELGDDFTNAVGSAAGIVVPHYEERSLTVHAPDGRRLARHRPRYGISGVQVMGRYGYVTNTARVARNQRTYVYDLRTGRRVREIATSTVPVLLNRSD